MFSEYLEKLNEISPLNEESEKQLLNHISYLKIKKGDFLLKHGEICKHLYYVDKGFLRIFYYKNGKEITEWFANEKQFCLSITSYFENTPSNLVVEANEDSRIILMSKKGQEELRKNNIEIANLMVAIFSRSLILSQKRMESIQFETAKQRYQTLINNQPSVLQKVSLQHIASYLGITQETLSRIRAKI